MKYAASLFGAKGTLRRYMVFLVIGANVIIAIVAFWGYTENNKYLVTIKDLSEMREMSFLADRLHEDTYVALNIISKSTLTHDEESKLSNIIFVLRQQIKVISKKSKIFDSHTDGHYSAVKRNIEKIKQAGQLYEKALGKYSNNLSDLEKKNIKQTVYNFGKELISLSTLFDDIADHHSNELENGFLSNKVNIILFALFTVPVFIISALLLTRIVIRSLDHLQENLKSIVTGTGDLNTLLPEEKGEAGEVAHLYNQLIIKLRASLLQVLEVASLLGNASRQLQTNAEHTRVGLVGQEAEVTDVITSMQNLESEINSIGDITKIAADVSAQTQSKTSSGQNLMIKTVEVIKKLNQDSIESSAKIERVVESANYIGTVTSVINEIAEQTNLLALNAAIEAARAGEQGRGFAVVADEVRKLAARTQNSVGEIKTIIEELKSNISVSQQAMNANQESANVAQDSINEMSASLREIGDSNNKIADMNQEIVEAITRQVELASGINRNTVNLQSTTKQAESNAISMESLSEKLTELVARLDITAETFNLQDHLDQAERDMIDTYSNKKELMHDDDKYKNDDVELF
ncbi:MAG: methyl-accepting chemotaxis protein [Candidatus Heimdallarchaeota archaeon]|nr:methyl-accepting chemotaxis protein [Candidatus Heimdallarchaeota archaeon]